MITFCAVESVPPKLLRSFGKVSSEVGVIGGPNTKIIAKVVANADWVKIGGEITSNGLAFEGWIALAQLWEVDARTTILIVTLDPKMTSDIVKDSVTPHGECSLLCGRSTSIRAICEGSA